MSVVDCSFDHPLKVEERASQPLAGGMMSHGYQCGMTWGATLAAGAQAYRLLGPGPQSEAGAIIAAQRLVEAFCAHNNSTDCFDIIGERMKNLKSPMQIIKVLFRSGGPIRCLSMAARYAPIAFREINSALSEKHVEAPPSPVSCSAMLAREMGASEMHAVMTAGLAGGIGLSGGACGALGAALWIIGMNTIKEGAGDNIWRSRVFRSRAGDTIDRFFKSANYEFECSAIVGRRFENVGDHAGHLRDGGCSELFTVLAAQ